MIRRLVAVVVLLLLGTAMPAQAGGPTSVLLSAPSAQKVVAAGYDDSHYRELQRLLDPTAGREPADTGKHDVGVFVRAAWLIHDMSVWRVDLIYPHAPGGPWIATSQYSPGDGTGGEVKPVWHRATDPVALVKLLNGLNLLRGERNGEQRGSGPTAPPWASSGGTEAPVPGGAAPGETLPAGSSQQEAAQDVTFLTGWRWILPGLLLGAALALLTRRFLPRRRWDLIEE